MKNIVVVGASGAIGSAFTELLSQEYPEAVIRAFARTENLNARRNIIYHTINYNDEESIEDSSLLASKDSAIDLVIVAIGLLHDEDLQPEKSLKDLSSSKFERIFAVNTILPAMIAKYFLPKLNKEKTSIFAALSARVGSISDNQLGGWYAYRASKAALNMIIKNAAIEIARSNKEAIVVGLHPGTVESNLSKPFSSKVSGNLLFSPEFAASKLLDVLRNLSKDQTGKLFAWDGEEIEP